MLQKMRSCLQGHGIIRVSTHNSFHGSAELLGAVEQDVVSETQLDRLLLI